MIRFNLRDANIARQAEWPNSEKLSLEFKGLELAGEVGEACNIIKKIVRENLGIPGTRATRGDLAAELADVVICSDLVAAAAGIDLNQAVIEKFNQVSRERGFKTILKKSGGEWDNPHSISDEMVDRAAEAILEVNRKYQGLKFSDLVKEMARAVLVVGGLK